MRFEQKLTTKEIEQMKYYAIKADTITAFQNSIRSAREKDILSDPEFFLAIFPIDDDKLPREVTAEPRKLLQSQIKRKIQVIIENTRLEFIVENIVEELERQIKIRDYGRHGPFVSTVIAKLRRLGKLEVVKPGWGGHSGVYRVVR